MGKLRFCPHMLYMQAEALFHRSSDLIFVLNTVLVSCADTGHSNPTRAAFFVRIFNAVRREPKTPPNKFFADYALFDFILGSGTQVSFAESEHRMRHNNKK